MRTRFAPSPTGPLHLGHAWAALCASDAGEMHLRIEDIDRARSRPEYEAAIHADLDWLGLPPHGPVLRQSDRLAVYGAALDALWARGLLRLLLLARRVLLLLPPLLRGHVWLVVSGVVLLVLCWWSEVTLW